MLFEILTMMGIALYVASMVIAYLKGKVKSQFILVALVFFVWLLFNAIKALAHRAGVSSDVLGIVVATLIELFINYVYPFAVGPLIAIIYAALMKREISK
ncbi:hypothetical protein J4209_04385 [Candidatus Woesearchaeota archaeon]|nr:hypothetical protein [Candidatus Woesearchaeota archaeon]